jgi:hypothetical protein
VASYSKLQGWEESLYVLPPPAPTMHRPYGRDKRPSQPGDGGQRGATVAEAELGLDPWPRGFAAAAVWKWLCPGAALVMPVKDRGPPTPCPPYPRVGITWPAALPNAPSFPCPLQKGGSAQTSWLHSSALGLSCSLFIPALWGWKSLLPVFLQNATSSDLKHS